MPFWVAILEAAGGDPLRAQEMEAGLTREWWEYWTIYHSERMKAAKEAAKANVE